jgi:hypothetical protein
VTTRPDGRTVTTTRRTDPCGIHLAPDPRRD